MRQCLVNLFLLILLLGITASAFAAFGVPYPADWPSEDVSLTITRTDLGTGWWTWRFDVLNNSSVGIQYFYAGFFEHEVTPGSSSTGHYRNWSDSVGGLVAGETEYRIRWAKDNNGLIAPGGAEWFSYDTDLPLVSMANYTARDDGYPPDWLDAEWSSKEAPMAPEPSSFLALAISGVGMLLGLRKRR